MGWRRTRSRCFRSVWLTRRRFIEASVPPQHAFHMAELDDEPVEEELVNEKANAVHATLCFFRSVCMLIHFVESYKAFRSHRVLEMVSTLSSLLPCLSLISNNDVVCEILLFVLEFLQTINKESGLDAGTVEAASADLLSSLVEVIVNKGFSQYLIANPFLVESMQLSSQFVLSVNDECATPNYITSYLLKGGFLIDHGMETYHSLTHVHCPYSVLESCNEVEEGGERARCGAGCGGERSGACSAEASASASGVE